MLKDNIKERIEQFISPNAPTHRFDMMLDEIETSGLSLQDKIELEKMVHMKGYYNWGYDRKRGRYEGADGLKEGAYNILLLAQSGKTKMTRDSLLASHTTLIRRGFLYGTYEPVSYRRVETQETDRDLLVSSKDRTVFITVLHLTELGKQELANLTEQAEFVAQNHLKKLKRLGIA